MFWNKYQSKNNKNKKIFVASITAYKQFEVYIKYFISVFFCFYLTKFNDLWIKFSDLADHMESANILKQVLPCC